MLRLGPSWGANSAPPDFLGGFWGDERKEKGRGRGRAGKKKSEGKRKGEEKGVKGKMRGREEKGTNGRDGGERERKRKEKRKGKGNGGILRSCDFSLGKTLLEGLPIFTQTATPQSSERVPARSYEFYAIMRTVSKAALRLRLYTGVYLLGRRRCRIREPPPPPRLKQMPPI